MKILSISLLSLTLAAGLLSCKKDDNNKPAGAGTITTIVSGDTSFSLLAAGVVKADLATTLSSAGPFTVFAPDNAAFRASGLDAATVNALPVNTLKSILLYHTLGSKVLSANVPAGPNAKVVTASGDSIFVTKNSAGVFVNGVMVTKADVAASNGVIHVLSRVLIPAVGNIVQTAQADTNFTYLVAAVIRASQGATNVAGVLSGAGPFTVFAPTNAAFRAAGFATISDINNADPNTLAAILTYHVVAGRVFSSDLSDGIKPATLNGGTVTITLTGGARVQGKSNIGPSNIIATNILATNGVVHVIDQVLLP